MKRLPLLALAALALAACGPNNVGSSGSAGTSGSNSTGPGPGSADGGTGGTSGGTSGGASFTCPTSHESYPANPYATSRGGIFPDFFLGPGYWNPSTTPTPDIPTFSVTQTMAFHQLYCSGFRYALVDISAIWCPHCNAEALELPSTYVPGWLKKGGIVFSILEEGNTPNVPATIDDLNFWVNEYSINYPMAIDPQETLVSGVTLQGWPANIILDLKTMSVVDAVFGATDSFLTEFDQTLNAAN